MINTSIDEYTCQDIITTLVCGLPSVLQFTMSKILDTSSVTSWNTQEIIPVCIRFNIDGGSMILICSQVKKQVQCYGVEIYKRAKVPISLDNNPIGQLYHRTCRSSRFKMSVLLTNMTIHQINQYRSSAFYQLLANMWNNWLMPTIVFVFCANIFIWPHLFSLKSWVKYSSLLSGILLPIKELLYL